MPSPAPSTTEQFLQLCLQSRIHPPALEAARALAAQVDWGQVNQRALQEGLAPLLYQTLRAQSFLPALIEQQWHQTYYSNACRNALLLRELGQILQVLSDRQIPVLLLKGAALAELIYQDIALRPMSDLDLLVQPRDLAATRQVLLDLGYRPWGVEMQTGYVEEFRNEEVFFKDQLTDVHIDLHWKLVSPIYYQNSLPIEWFWRTALPISIHGAPALVMGCEAQVLYLCAHLLLHHQGEGLLWQQDVAEVITLYQHKIDWQLLLHQAQVCQFVLPLQQVLPTLAQQRQLAIPPGWLEQLSGLTPSRYEVRIFNWSQATHLKMTVRCFLVDLSGITRWPQRCKFVWNTLFPTQAYMRYRYQVAHPLLMPWYYVYRLLLGLWRVPEPR